MASPLDALPARNSRQAPVWKETDTTRDDVELFFKDLDRLYAQNSVSTGTDQKKGATSLYVPPDVAKAWALLDTFADAAKTWEDFKEEVLGFYVGSDKDHVYTRREYRSLIDSTIASGIRSLAEYLAFYRQFFPRYKYLSTKQPTAEVSGPEAVDDLLRVVPVFVRDKVDNYLNLKHPNKHKDDSYPLADVHEAITYSLEGIPRALDSRTPPTYPTPAPATGTERRSQPVKSEPTIETLQSQIQNYERDLRDLRDLTRGWTNLLAARPPQVVPPPLAPAAAQPAAANLPPPMPPRMPQNQYGYMRPPCFYCNEENCHSRRCPAFAEDAANGLVIRNERGYMVLPNGNEVPRNWPGLTMRDRVHNWHEHNPGQKVQAAAAQMMVTVESNMLEGATNVTDIQDRIDSLRHQASMLEHRVATRSQGKLQFDGVELPARKKTVRIDESRNQAHAPPDAVVDLAREARGGRDLPPHLSPAEDRAGSPSSPLAGPELRAREHPYARARDATNAGDLAPLATKKAESNPPVTAPAPLQPAPRAGTEAVAPPPRPTPVLVDPTAGRRVFERAFGKEQQVMVSPAELVSISPEVRKYVHEATSPRRVYAARQAVEGAQLPPAPREVTAQTAEPARTTPEPGLQVAQSMVQQAWPWGPDDEDEEWSDEEEGEEFYDALPEEEEETHCFRTTVEEVEDEDDDFRARAPLHSRVETIQGEDLIVAEPLAPLRSIYGFLGATDLTTECVLDSGSQSISISVEHCHRLKIAYDPTARLNMVSANGTSDTTLGMARHVPLEVADGFIVYLQMQVVEHASFDVLLGRPFELLTAMKVNNELDGRQSITITCPNTHGTITLPTYARGEPPARTRSEKVKPKKSPLGFLLSRI